MGHKHTMVCLAEPSPTGKLLLYSVDHDGREFYTLYIKDIAEDKVLPDDNNCSVETAVWGNDDSCYFYVSNDNEYDYYNLMDII